MAKSLLVCTFCGAEWDGKESPDGGHTFGGSCPANDVLRVPCPTCNAWPGRACNVIGTAHSPVAPHAARRLILEAQRKVVDLPDWRKRRRVLGPRAERRKPRRRRVRRQA